MDTGAFTDILDEDVFSQVNQNNNIALQPTVKRLLAYGSTDQLETIGQFNCTVAFRDQKHNGPSHVLKGNHGSLLSYSTVKLWGLSIYESNISLLHLINCDRAYEKGP